MALDTVANAEMITGNIAAFGVALKVRRRVTGVFNSANGKVEGTSADTDVVGIRKEESIDFMGSGRGGLRRREYTFKRSDLPTEPALTDRVIDGTEEWEPVDIHRRISNLAVTYLCKKSN